MKARIVLSLLTVVIVLGAVMRFSYLDRKFYYGDEVISSLRESGHTESEFARAFDGKVRTVRDISQYLSDRRTTPGDTVRSLAAEDPQHPPLYYLAARYWTQFFGDGLGARRSLAAALGALALLSVFWLAYELFGSLETAAVASALVAVSPFHVIYAQQNREYSAWLLLLAIQGALLLRALKGPGAWWLAYAGGLVLALYTDTLVLYDIVSFTLFVALRERRWSPALRNYTAATAAACLAYVPWFIVLFRGAGTITGWMGPLRVAVSPQIYALKWLFNAAAVFFDLEYERSWLIPVAVGVLLLVAASFVLVVRTLDPNARTFVLSLALVPAVAFVASDWLSHTSRATAPRYLMPVWLGCELAVAYAVGLLLAGAPGRRRALGFCALAFLVGCGVASNVANLPASETSATAEMGALGPQARAINSARTPLVVYVHDGRHWDIGVAMLATVLRPDVRVQLFERLSDVRIAHPDAGFFLYEPSLATKAALVRATGGRWSPVRVQAFGSQFVARLRWRADRDRGAPPRSYGEDEGLWQRMSGAVAGTRRAGRRADPAKRDSRDA